MSEIPLMAQFGTHSGLKNRGSDCCHFLSFFAVAKSFCFFAPPIYENEQKRLQNLLDDTGLNTIIFVCFKFSNVNTLRNVQTYIQSNC